MSRANMQSLTTSRSVRFLAPLFRRTPYDCLRSKSSIRYEPHDNGQSSAKGECAQSTSHIQISDIAAMIKENTERYEQYLSSNALPVPSHKADYAAHSYSNIILPEDIVESRDKAIHACQELGLLLEGPARNILSGASEQFLAICLRFICRHNIVFHVPIDGKISVEELAERCSLDREDVLRTLRCAQAWHVFTEPSEGYFAHSASTRFLREDKRFHAWIKTVTEEVWPSIPHLVDAMARWPGSEDPSKTACSIAHGVDESGFTSWNKDPEKAADFITAMSFWNTAPGFEARHLLSQFDFSQLPDPAIFVDLGGSLGYACKEVAAAFPHITTIVQDLPATIEHVPKDWIPVELRNRVKFMAHDFFNPQPVVGADVYYFRTVLHDWSDATCITILQNLAPAMKAGSKILVTDTCVPKFGEVSMVEQRRIRSLDMSMKAFANAKERSAEDWASLFRAADERFSDFTLTLPQWSQRLALMSVTWKP